MNDRKESENIGNGQVGDQVLVKMPKFDYEEWYGTVREGDIEAVNDDGTVNIRIGESVRAKWTDGGWVVVERY